MHKHAIRREFHRQLRQHWSTDIFLTKHHTRILQDVLPKHEKLKYQFLPLVRKEWYLTCSLQILFLRRDVPGGVIQAGDLDNRIKTLIDALRCPQHQNELVQTDATPGPDETPFFCLMEDDSLVSHLSVETDNLLDPPAANEHGRNVKLVITVELGTYYATTFNASLVG